MEAWRTASSNTVTWNDCNVGMFAYQMSCHYNCLNFTFKTTMTWATGNLHGQLGEHCEERVSFEDC